MRELTRRYEAGKLLDGQHEIKYLWAQVDKLEPEDWPAGVVPPPKPHDEGAAGFPDGAGLYRRTGDPLPRFPVGGVMFVGHYTDAVGNRAKWRSGGLSPGEPPTGKMPTWTRLYEMLDRAGIGREEIFFTNVYVGLVAGSDSRVPFPGKDCPSFCAWCDAFLDEQIALMRPQAVVTLGQEPARKFGWPEHAIADAKPRAGVRFNGAAVMHPSAGGHLNNVKKGSSERWMDHEVRILRQVVGG